MPELPEVETIVRDLKSIILNKKIGRIVVLEPKTVLNKEKSFTRELEGRRIAGLERRGKHIIFLLDNGKILVIHLKMTGQLILSKQNKFISGGHSHEKGFKDLPNTFTRLIIEIKKGGKLFFNDIRKFGYAQVISRRLFEEQINKRLGPEPLQRTFTLDALLKIFNRYAGSTIKQFLLDQKKISGIGNIYADEICFYARVLPDRKVQSLSLKEKNEVFKGIKKVLSQAIKLRGTSFSDYLDGRGKPGAMFRLLKVHQRGGSLCKKCKKCIISKARVGQRGTYFCQLCQK